MGNLFDATQLFDGDYLHFYEPLLTDEQSDRDADLVCSLAPVCAGDRVLDLACGHGRVANRLAARGAVVTGLDMSAAFLERARADAARRGLEVAYVQGLAEDLAWEQEFDVVVSWFTSFGYASDDGSRALLRSVHRSLRPGGRFLLEGNHMPNLLGRFQPHGVVRRGDDFMVDERRFDPVSGRVHTRRTVVRGGRVRAFEFSVRLLAFPELASWLRDAGFASVEGFGEDGKPLAHEHRRAIVHACV